MPGSITLLTCDFCYIIIVAVDTTRKDAVKSPDNSHPDEVLQWLSDPIRAIRDGLDHGVSLADTIMEDLPFEPHLRAHLTRLGALMHLGDITSDRWSLGRKLPLSGIEVSCEPFTLRVLRSQHGNPPHPGRSQARQRYWCQLPLFSEQWTMSAGANLILDWSLAEDQSIALALSKPTAIWPYRGAPRLEWRRAVVDDADAGLKFIPAEDGTDVSFDLTELEERGGDDWGANSAGA